MANDYSIAAEPERWRFVCSLLPVEDSPVQDADYKRWAEAHLDRHAHRELLFCFEGEACERFAGRDYRCRPGSVFLVDANEEHARGYPTGGDDFSHLWIGLGGGGGSTIFYSQSGGKATSKSMPMALAAAECALLTHCWERLRHPEPWMSPALRRTALSSAVFSLVFRALGNWLAPPGAPSSGRGEIVAAVRRHIEDHLDEAADLDALAHLSGYSKFHFARMFKECSGQTVHGFVEQCRVRRAAALIQEGVPRKEIAGELGFSCPAAFSNWLRKNRSRA